MQLILQDDTNKADSTRRQERQGLVRDDLVMLQLARPAPLLHFATFVL
jgi:hypothetical protein